MNIFFGIWFLGILPCYLMGRAAHRACGSWTVGERLFVIFSCATSWFAFLIYLSTWLIDTGRIKDIFSNEAKW